MSNPETEIGGGLRQFPSTSLSLFGELGDANPDRRRARLERLVADYWKPIYCVIRSGWNKSNEDAKDLTQEFFVRVVLEGTLLEGFDPDRGSFRTYLKGALSHFMLNEGRSACAQKRGGDARILSLDMEEKELSILLPDAKHLPPDQAFDAAWKNTVLSQALRRLEERLAGRDGGRSFRIFRRYELETGPEAPSYQAVANELGLTSDVVKHALRGAREAFRSAVEDVLREYARDPDTLSRELRDLFGA